MDPTDALAPTSSPYHREEAPFGHNHCPNCGEPFPPEFLFPTNVGKIVQVVWRQNRMEKQAAKDLAKQTPQKLIQEIQEQHRQQQQLQKQVTGAGAATAASATSLEGGAGGGGKTRQQQQQDDLDMLLAAADDNFAALVPTTLYNLKSPDWTDLPPCIARYRLSLFQLRLNAKMMEKMTSLCENCFESFFPGEDPSAQQLPQQYSQNSRGFNSTFNNNNNNNATTTTNSTSPKQQQQRTPMKPSITFEEYLAQSRFPDRSKDFAFSDVGRAMRHAAAEARAKNDIRNSLFAHIDRAQEMISMTTTAGTTSSSVPRDSPFYVGSNNNNNNNNAIYNYSVYDDGDQTGGGGSSGGGGGGAVTWLNENTANARQAFLMTNTNGELTASHHQQQQQHYRPHYHNQHHHIRFLLGGDSTLAEMVENQAVDQLPISILDVPYGDWLQRELWDELTRILEFGKDVGSSSSISSPSSSHNRIINIHNNSNNNNSNSNQAVEDVPTSHPFFELYSKNRFRLPNPSSLFFTSGFESVKVNRWSPKFCAAISASSNSNKKRSAGAAAATMATTRSSSSSSSSSLSPSPLPGKRPASPQVQQQRHIFVTGSATSTKQSKLDLSYLRDQQSAREFSIPDNLNDQERKCLIEIICGLSLSDGDAKNDARILNFPSISTVSSSSTTGAGISAAGASSRGAGTGKKVSNATTVRSCSSLSDTGKNDSATTASTAFPDSRHVSDVVAGVGGVPAQDRHQQQQQLHHRHQQQQQQQSATLSKNQQLPQGLENYRFGFGQYQQQHFQDSHQQQQQQQQHHIQNEFPSAIEDFFDSPVS